MKDCKLELKQYGRGFSWNGIRFVNGGKTIYDLKDWNYDDMNNLISEYEKFGTISK